MQARPYAAGVPGVGWACDSMFQSSGEVSLEAAMPRIGKGTWTGGYRNRRVRGSAAKLPTTGKRNVDSNVMGSGIGFLGNSESRLQGVASYASPVEDLRSPGRWRTTIISPYCIPVSACLSYD